MSAFTSAPLSTADVGEVTHQVFVRSIANGLPPVNGEREGWVYDPYLLCTEVRRETGPRIGFAKFTIVPPTDTDADKAMEELVFRYTVSDQVRVVVQPPIDELQAQPDGDVTPEIVLFEGRIARIPFGAQANRKQDTEGAAIIAKPLPHYDNDLSTHQVLGRWVAGDEDGEVRVLDGYTLPAVFNHKGKPNMNATAAATVDAPSGGFLYELFTSDDDPNGRYWTVRSAMISLLGQWLYGSRSDTSPTVAKGRSRVSYLETDTLDGLFENIGGTLAERWVGLDDILPETRVHGMGTLEALQAICDAAGFEFAVLPDQDPDSERPWFLSIWRKNSGPTVTPALAKRGSTFASSEASLAQNDVNIVTGMIDGSEMTNEVVAVARTVLEVTALCKPLWNEDDVDGTAVDEALQSSTSELLAGEGYHAKHVAGGALFDQYKHVGRRWGIAHRADAPGYTSGIYTHGGVYDWVGNLGLNDDDSTLKLEREAAGVLQPIWWLKDRPRRAQPLKHATAVARGIDYVVEVSENAGTTWSFLPWRVRTLRDWFGIDLSSYENLARVSLAALATGALPDPAASWWALIKTQQLLFRLTAAIDADHGDRFNALRQPTSGTPTPFGRVLVSDTEVRYAHSFQYFQRQAGVTETWQRVTPAGTAPQLSLKALAERTRDANEDRVLSATLGTWIMDFRKYQLGYQVTGLRGRNFTFAVSSGSAGYRYPTIVGITFRLGTNNQSIELSLSDHRLAAGR